MWNDNPLSTLSMCEQTWIDGRKFFDAKEDKAMNEQIQQQRAVLIQKYYTIKWATIAAVNLHVSDGSRRERLPRSNIQINNIQTSI